MTEILATVTRSGLATVQDGGRPGYADVGVPVAGALHRERYLQASSLMRGGPDPGCPAIEILHGGVVLRTRTALVACIVGPAACAIDGRRAAVGTVMAVPADVELSVSHRGPGPSYLVVGGWSPPLTLGSASTDTFARLGGAVVAPGLVLRGDADRTATAMVGAFHRDLPEPSGPLRVVAAGSPLLDDFADRSWQVTDVARSGVRLAGQRLPAGGTVSSAPMLPGAIQLTPSGEAIILGPDGGLTGGYPVVGVTATVDLDRLSLLQPGATVQFRVIDVDEAVRARADRVDLLRRRLLRMHLLG